MNFNHMQKAYGCKIKLPSLGPRISVKFSSLSFLVFFVFDYDAGSEKWHAKNSCMLFPNKKIFV